MTDAAQTPTLTVLILGGYGAFGGRLVRLLADDKRLVLIIAGRSKAKAEAFAAGLPAAKASVHPAVFDRDGDVLTQLRALSPDMVADASGPFQDYGPHPYRVAEAALALGIDYLDLADATAFVCGISQFDAAAKARGVALLSGVSTCPVLTAAAVRRLADGMVRVDSITGGIAPSPFAGVGLSVIQAIAGYAGKPLRVLRDGHETSAYALIDARRFTVAPPGALPLHNRWFALVDVPDLTLLPPLWPGLQSIWFGAGLAPGLYHQLLRLAAWPVRLAWLRSLEPLAPLFQRILNTVRWGEHRSGMFVEIDGTLADGQRLTRSWHVIAEGDDGPMIPAIPAAAIIRQRLMGRRPAAGARPAVAELELADYEAFFARLKIVTGVREGSTAAVPTSGEIQSSHNPLTLSLSPEGRGDERAASLFFSVPSPRWGEGQGEGFVTGGNPSAGKVIINLYPRSLGSAWGTLPEPIRHMHDFTSERIAEGRASVEGAEGWVARVLARAFGFPVANPDVPVRVHMTLTDGVERWQRKFGNAEFVSWQSEGTGRMDALIAERFGPFVFGLAPVVDNGKLHLICRCWTAFGLPMPLWAAPNGTAFEHAEDGRFHFDVDIRLPLVGRLVHYRGWLEVEDSARYTPSSS